MKDRRDRSTSDTTIPNVLTIAGTDPSGGAGIQADLKAFSALGAYGMSVVTALVAQNTQGVDRILEIPADFVAAQIDTLFADVAVDAVKIGMVNTAEVASTIVDRLRRYRPSVVVLDPVMVAKSGDKLLTPDAVAVMRDELVPLATVITPNLPEAAVLTGREAPTTIEEMHDAVRSLHQLGPRSVLLKGGHLDDESSTDLLFDGTTVMELRADRIRTANSHGTGCTLSAAIAALAPQRDSLARAVEEAKEYLTGALRHSDELDVGHGHGPTHHFYALWKTSREEARR